MYLCIRFLFCRFFMCFLFCVMFVAVGQRQGKFWPCAVFEVTGGGVKANPKSYGANVQFLRRENFELKNFKKKKNKNFVSCVMWCDVIRFVLRHFLGFLAGFLPICPIVIHFDKIRGLERLKMRFCCFCVLKYSNKYA